MTLSWPIFTEFYHVLCDNQSGFENNDNACIHGAKNALVNTPMREFEEAVVNAFMVQGINISRRVKSGKRFTDSREFVENNPYWKDNFRYLSDEDSPECLQSKTCFQLPGM